MKPEKQNLIRDLLEEDSQREETLLAGARILRRRRHWRTARRGIALAALALVTTGLWIRHETARVAPAQIAKAAPKPVETQVEALTDDQLLSMFPKTPVGLLPLNGKKRLVFLHPGDEKRLITKL